MGLFSPDYELGKEVIYTDPESGTHWRFTPESTRVKRPAGEILLKRFYYGQGIKVIDSDSDEVLRHPVYISVLERNLSPLRTNHIH